MGPVYEAFGNLKTGHWGPSVKHYCIQERLLRQAAQGIPFDIPHEYGWMLILLLLKGSIRILSETPMFFIPELTQKGRIMLTNLERRELQAPSDDGFNADIPLLGRRVAVVDQLILDAEFSFSSTIAGARPLLN